ncbi:MAG: ATP-binding protein, partial [Parvibaculum sp.]
MAFVEKVIISEFWGDHVVDISFFQDVNFLIGPNGSEKTTAINIIAAALSADFINLDRLPFGKVEITLNDPNTRRKPIIEVVKTKKNPSLFPSIEYSIKEKSTGEAKKYSLSDIEEDRMLRDYPHRWRQSRLYRTFFSDLTEKLAALAPTSWLSIHRAAGPRPVREEKSYEFSVDQKLEEISNSFVR